MRVIILISKQAYPALIQQADGLKYKMIATNMNIKQKYMSSFMVSIRNSFSKWPPESKRLQLGFLLIKE